MKKNDWILLCSVLAYSFLFYHAGRGVNFLIFTVLLISFLIIRNKEVIKNRPWLIAATGSLASAFCVFYFGNSLSLVANIISLMLLSALSWSPDTSVITSLFFAFYSVIGSSIFMILDSIKRVGKRVNDVAERSGFIRFMLYVFPIGVLVLFFILYKGSNPVFDNFTNKINLDFISAGWIFFTVGGAILLYGFYYHKTINVLADLDKAAPDSVLSANFSTTSWLSRNLSIENEVLSGTILLSLLNILLLVVNVLDINYLWLKGNLPEGLTYSDFVHQGTGLLIGSIIIAILIIMFYFRGRVNLYHHNKAIKLLAFLWILQNAFMIISTAARNDLYIHEYSLTYKRIGVYIWLLLALIGLSVTFMKILKARTNWYLFRVNSWMFYCVLVVSCFINWDQIIANFNIGQAESHKKALDKFYLLSLSDKVLPQLLVLNDSIKNKADEENIESVFRSEWDNVYRDNGINFKTELSEKLYYFLNRMDSKDWRSLSISEQKVYERILDLNRNNKIHSLSLNRMYNLSLKPLIKIDNLKNLELSETGFKDFPELRYFKKLEALDISKCSIKSLSLMPSVPSLKELNVSENNVKSIAALVVFRNLEKLDVSGNDIKNYAPLLQLKKLKYLKIGKITAQGLKTLQNVLPEVKIDAVIVNP